MAQQQAIPLEDIEEISTGAAVNVAALEDKTLFVGGTFVGTYSVQESPDGVTYVSTTVDATDATDPPAYELKAGTSHVRLDVTVLDSGTITAVASGRDPSRL